MATSVINTREFDDPRLWRKTRSHDHPEASCATPWWEYACKTCDPELWEFLLTPESHPSYNLPRSYECPFCLERIGYPKGAFRRHQEDVGVDCRGTGLSLYVATALLRGCVKGWSIGRLMAEESCLDPTGRRA